MSKVVKLPRKIRPLRTTMDVGRDAYAKFDAEQVARGLNLLVQYGMEELPQVKEAD